MHWNGLTTELLKITWRGWAVFISLQSKTETLRLQYDLPSEVGDVVPPSLLQLQLELPQYVSGRQEDVWGVRARKCSLAKQIFLLDVPPLGEGGGGGADELDGLDTLREELRGLWRRVTPVSRHLHGPEGPQLARGTTQAEAGLLAVTPVWWLKKRKFFLLILIFKS